MGPIFDVFVVGVTQGTAEPAAVASALAARLGMAPAAVAQGLADRKLCVGRGLEAGAAQGLVRDLRAVGAMTVMQPAPARAPAAPGATRAAAAPARAPAPNGAAPARPAPAAARPAARPASPAPAPTARPAAAKAPATPSRPPAPAARAAAPRAVAAPAPDADGLSIGNAEGADPFAPPGDGDRFDLPDSAGADRFAPPEERRAPPASSAPAAAGGRASSADLFEAPASEDEELSLDTAAPAAPPRRQPPPDPSPDPLSDEPSLELDTTPRSSSEEFQKAPRTVGGAAALNVSRLAPMSGASGLTVDSEAAADAYRVRCPKHGLTFDTRKASGCAKCMAPGRKMSAAMAEKARPFKLMDFEDSPAKRAFVGLGIALVMGFIPAAYHALGVASRELHRLREEQETLSRRPATQEIVRRFAELDEVVDTSKGRYTRNTGVIWVVVTGGALIGWYRVT